jgi:cytoskeletal protein CcmA (bactofilin family)
MRTFAPSRGTVVDPTRSALVPNGTETAQHLKLISGFGNIFRYAVTLRQGLDNLGKQSAFAVIQRIQKEGLTVSQPGKQSSGSNTPVDRKGDAPVVIGKGMIIKGRIHSEEDVFLNGEMEGDLDIENYRLTIGPDGKVAANARAREVDISGTLIGNVESTEKTCIRASGRLTGDVKTRGIVIEEGALFKGKVEIIAKPEPAREATSRE